MPRLAGARGFALGAALAVLVAPAADAHRTSLARSELLVEGNTARLELTVSVHDLAVALGLAEGADPRSAALLGANPGAVAAYLRSRVALHAGDDACAVDAGRTIIATDTEHLRHQLLFRCPRRIEALRFSYRVLFEVDRAHRNAGVLVAGGSREEFLLDAAYADLETRLSQPPAAHAALRFARTVALGVEHIVVGADHVLFLLVLLVVPMPLARLVAVVTTFTVAHSLTLGLAWYGLLAVPETLVEMAIAASIALVAGANALGAGASRRWLAAGTLGLVHGMGFYAALSGLGLDGQHALLTLAGFNLGVELGQLALLLAAWLPLRWWQTRRWFRPSMRLLSSLAAVLACAWMVQRATGL